ncbi:nucleotidyltransferase family protein [Roseovarius sp. SCSIO 43702]|uniref:nucleotidyltransferase family protein n=1 Tax=Roseovarius sp. SCSIO 43702 TaxID=2823043 RepID=UPI001C738AC2|nr:nucleotidyltransferase family protein [Roseovarius sp. SCSIO 43702]QYX58451.1 nucleotidyltransferase family protein [Roseovarius sp. SCSIO 43702]
MLFAAGFGTRMRPLTDLRPKPLIEVAGRTLLDHALDVASGVPVTRIVVNAHYKADQIIANLASQDIAVSLEESRILDTGGGLKAALPLFSAETIATLNTDAVWTGPNALGTLLAAWDPARMDALLLCVPSNRTEGRAGPGDFSRDGTGSLKRGGDLVYTGAQLIKRSVVETWPDDVFSLNALWNALLDERRLCGVEHPDHWCDVGHPGGIATAEKLLGTTQDV